MTPTTEAGQRLLAWAQSDMRPLPEFGWDEIADAIVDIERQAAARQDEPSPALRERLLRALPGTDGQGHLMVDIIDAALAANPPQTREAEA